MCVCFDVRKRAFCSFDMLIFALELELSLHFYGLIAVIETIDYWQSHSLQLKLVFVSVSKAIVDNGLIEEVQCLVCVIFSGFLRSFVLLDLDEFLYSLDLCVSEGFFTIFGPFVSDGAHFMCLVLFE